MNILIWLIVGGLIGWLASKIMTTDGQRDVVLNVVIGIAGALIGGWFLSPALGISTINQNNFSTPGLLVSLAGAVALLAIVKFLRTYNLRW
jgi:uncharacterized membrane protein YeaQ/YmgE (transglycosylase-associated protein family)